MISPLLPQGLFMIMFSVISMDFFQLEPAQNGYLLSYFGILMMVSGYQAPRAGPGSRTRPSFSAALGCAAPPPPPHPGAEHHDSHSLPLLRPPLRLCTQASAPTHLPGAPPRGEQGLVRWRRPRPWPPSVCRHPGPERLAVDGTRTGADAEAGRQRAVRALCPASQPSVRRGRIPSGSVWCPRLPSAAVS